MPPFLCSLPCELAQGKSLTFTGLVQSVHEEQAHEKIHKRVQKYRRNGGSVGGWEPTRDILRKVLSKSFLKSTGTSWSEFGEDMNFSSLDFIWT